MISHLTWFGFVQLPSLVGSDSVVGYAIGDVHKTLAVVLLAIIALRTRSARYNALVLRDRTLRRIVPGMAGNV